jgi:hypothetical protein
MQREIQQTFADKDVKTLEKAASIASKLAQEALKSTQIPQVMNNKRRGRPRAGK